MASVHNNVAKQKDPSRISPGPLPIGAPVYVLSSTAKGWVKATVVASNSEAACVQYQIGEDKCEKTLSIDSERLQMRKYSSSVPDPAGQKEHDPNIWAHELRQ